MDEKKFLQDFIKHGGYIVGSDECSEMEIADAKLHGRMFVDDNGFGHIRRLKKNWDLMKAAYEHCYHDAPKPSLEDF